MRKSASLAFKAEEAFQYAPGGTSFSADFCDIQSDRIPDTNVLYYGRRPEVTGGSPLQRSLGHAETTLLGEVAGKFQISYQFLTANAAIKVFSNARVDGDLIVQSQRNGAVCGRLDLYILQETKSLEILEKGAKGLASKTIVISKKQDVPLKIILDHGANTPHFFTLDITGEAPGSCKVNSSHALEIDDRIVGDERVIRISR